MARRPMHGRTARRETLWLFFSPISATFTAVGGTLLGSLNAAALALRPFTIIRQYYEMMIVSDQAAAIETQIGAFATAVVSDQATAIGVTAVPTPISDLGSDLFMQHQIFMADESNLTDRSKPGAHYSIQSKAMRRVNGDQDMALVAEFSPVGNGFSLTVGGRILIKLH